MALISKFGNYTVVGCFPLTRSEREETSADSREERAAPLQHSSPLWYSKGRGKKNHCRFGEMFLGTELGNQAQ